MTLAPRAIYFAPVPYASPKQRAHFFARFLVDAGYSVTWVEPPPARLPRLTDLRHVTAGLAPAVAIESSVDVAKAGLLPIEPLPLVSRVNDWRIARFLRQYADPERLDLIAVGRPSRLAANLLELAPHIYTIYDAMDDFPEFMTGRAKRQMHLAEEMVARWSDLIVASCANIAGKFEACPAATLIINNACDSNSVGQREGGGSTVLGYVGTIGSWFDWSTVIRLAEACPDFEVELVGPIFGARPSRLPVNVSLKGALPHHKAMQRLKRYAAGLIPFRVNALTDSVDPVKYYEYRAAGLPVISTAFGTMSGRGAQDHVYHIIPEASARFVVEQAISSPSSCEATAAFRNENDWSVRWLPLRSLLESELDTRAVKRIGSKG